MKKKHNFTWHFRELDEEYIHLLINYKKKLQFEEVNEKTLHQYLRQLKDYFLFLQERNIMPINATVEMIEEYFNGLDVSDSRRKVIKSILNRYYAHLKRRGYVKKNVVQEYSNKMNN